MIHGEEIKTKFLPSFMHHFSCNPSVIQLVSCRFTITIQNLLHFLKYFDENKIYMKNFPLGFAKFLSTHLSCFGFFCTNAERFE